MKASDLINRGREIAGQAIEAGRDLAGSAAKAAGEAAGSVRDQAAERMRLDLVSDLGDGLALARLEEARQRARLRSVHPTGVQRGGYNPVVG